MFLAEPVQRLRNLARGIVGGESGMSLLEIVLALAVVVVVIWLALGRLGRGPGDRDSLAGGPPDLVSSLDHARQKQTVADMEQIARANDLRRAETGRYAERVDQLAARGQALGSDAWGNPYVYRSDRGSYTLTSLGSDGAPGPEPPQPWPSAPYEPDLVLVDGGFTQAPDG